MLDLTPEELTAITLSLRVAAVATLVSLPFGIAVAMLIGRGRFSAGAIRSVLGAAAERKGVKVTLRIHSVEEEQQLLAEIESKEIIDDFWCGQSNYPLRRSIRGSNKLRARSARTAPMCSSR